MSYQDLELLIWQIADYPPAIDFKRRKKLADKIMRAVEKETLRSLKKEKKC